MKILQISNYYYPHIGGIEQVARDISCALKDEHEIRVFSFNHEKNDVNIEVDGVPVIKAGSFIKISSQSLSFSYGKLLKEQFRSFVPDVVIFHYPNPFAAKHLLKVLKKFPTCKLVLYWHLDIVKQKFLKLFFKKQNVKLLERATKIVATSPNYIVGSDYLSTYANKCVVVPNCVSEDRMKISDAVTLKAEKIRADADKKTICFACGRHVPYKGLEYLVRASKFLNDSFAINIAGKGPLTQKLKKIATGDKKIKFLGKVTDEDLLANLIACDVFCFPSITKNEAFGIALAEAMAFSKPSVTFTVEGSGINYVSLNGVTGIEVENKNVIQFAKAIKRLASDKELAAKYGAAAKERVIKLFSNEMFKENVRNMLEGL